MTTRVSPPAQTNQPCNTHPDSKTTQMVTHKHLFTDVERHPNNNEGSSASIGNGAAAPAPALTGAAVVAGGEAAAVSCLCFG